jgi:enterochelin esterase-like enzyme
VKNKGSLRVEHFRSKVLKSNPLDDPYERDMLIYLPPSYQQDKSRYPVVYCFGGLTSSAQSWFNFQAWIPRMDERVDQLIATGMNEMILVFPDCFTKYGGSQYLDSFAVGMYRSYLLQEIIPFVDVNYRTKRDRRYRGILGKSSGGYGAITISMDHPDLFSAVACHSGDMYFEYAYLPDFPPAVRVLEKVGGLQQYLKEFEHLPKTAKDEHALINVVAMSACYSPNLQSKPHLFDLPFEEGTGRLNDAVWKRWKEKDPVEIVAKKGIQLKDFGVVYLDCGKRDEYFLNLGSRIFISELKKRKVKYEYEEFEGGHSYTQTRYDHSLLRFSNYFGKS